MSGESTLMVIKVVGLVAAGAAFVWWQFRDLAREKKRSDSKKSSLRPPDS